MGFNQETRLDLELIRSEIPTDFSRNQAGLAQTAIGERDVRATPVQMAMIAATVANGGVSMQPFLVSETFDRDLGRHRNNPTGCARTADRAWDRRHVGGTDDQGS